MLMSMSVPPALPIISRSLFVPMTISEPVPSPKPFMPPNVGNTVGLLKRMAFSYAFLYQEMPKLGTLGGFSENEPLIEICGSLSGGKDHEKLNAPLIALIALDTVSRAPLIALDIVLCTLEKTPETIPTPPLIAPEIVPGMLPNIEDTVFLILLTMLDIVLYIPLNTEDMVLLILLIMLDIVLRRLLNIVVAVLNMFWNAV